jgi:hypothetical protein
LNSCGSFSKVERPPVPKNPCAGSSVWQPLQVAIPSVAGWSRKVARPFSWGCVSELSSSRIGFGGSVSASAKRAKAHVVVREGALVAPQEAVEGDVERLEGELLVEGEGVALERSPGAIAAPVHRAVVREAAQGLGRHRALHRVEGQRVPDRPDRVRTGGHDVVGVAEVPAQAVEVPEHMAAGARRLAVARREPGVVEEAPALADLGRLGIVERVSGQLGAARRVDHLHGIVEAREHVEAVARLVEGEARRPPSAHLDVIGGGGHEAVRRDLEGVEDADLARAESGDVERSVARDRHAEGRGEARLFDPGGHRVGAVAVGQRGDVLVQVAPQHHGAVDDADPRLVEVAPHAAGGDARPLEPDLVAGVGLTHVEDVRRRIDRHAEDHGADVGEGLRLDGRVREGVEPEHVEVREVEAHGRGPVPAQLVEP